MKGALLPFLTLWMSFEGAFAEQSLRLSAPTAPPVPLALPTLRLPLSPSRSSNGPDNPHRPEDEQLDGPQGWAWLTPKEQVHQAPDWKVPTRMGLALRKEPPPVTSGQAKGLVKWQGTPQAQPKAMAVLEAGAGKPKEKQLILLKAGMAPGTPKGALATEEGQRRKAGGRKTMRRGPKPRRLSKETCRPSRPGAWHQQEDQSRGWGSRSSTSQAAGCVWKRPGSGRGPGPRVTSLSSREQAVPSLPASCLLTQAAIACGNANMKHIPALVEPGLTSLYLAENEIAKLPAHAFLGLPNLEWLDLSKNKLDTRGLHPHAFKNLTQLKRLNLDGNSLSTVPALPTSLQELKLNDNLLQGLQRSSFQGLSNLLTLEVEGNQLHDGNISPLAFQSLSSLLYLRLGQNRLRTIPPGLPASLQELHLGNNLLEEVTENVLDRSHGLTVLVLSHNQLQEDRLAPRAWIDLPKLETLDLSHNQLVHVPSFLPRGLRHLTLHHNLIERIPGYVFAHMKPGLEFLHLSYNRLRTEGVHTVSFLGLHTSLAELLLDHNQLQAIPPGLLGLKGLRVLRLSHNKIRQVPLNSICDTRVAQDSNLIATYLDNNLIDLRGIPSTAFSCIRTYHSVVLKPQQGEGGLIALPCPAYVS